MINGHRRQISTHYALLALLLLAACLQTHALPHHTQASHYQKPGANVQLRRPTPDLWQPHTSKRLTYTFSSPVKTGRMTVYFSHDEALIVNDAREFYVFDLENGVPELSFDVIAAEVGRHGMRFYVELDGLGRAMTHRVQIGDEVNGAAKRISKTSETIASGQKLTISNARETLKAK